MPFVHQLGCRRCLGVLAVLDLRLRSSVGNVDLELDQEFHGTVLGGFDGHPEPRSWRSSPDRLVCGGGVVVEGLEGGDVDFGEGGEGLDGVAQHVEGNVGADGEGGLL